jgi:hypothetical protein
VPRTGSLRDGLITHSRDYWDLADVLRQIGVAEIPPLP